MIKKFKKSKAKHLKLGTKGEHIACRLLNNKGYDILHKNYRSSRGEIDIIARDGSILCFIEVKTRRHKPPQKLSHNNKSQSSKYATCNPKLVAPCVYDKPWVSHKQTLRIKNTAKDYLYQIENPQIKYRFDLVEITLSSFSIKKIYHWLYSFGYGKSPS